MTVTPHLVALDVDGTTINHAGEMSPVVRDAVRAVADAGHHVTIATGRSIVATTPILALLGLTTGYAVCSNGAVTLRLDPALEGGYEVIEAVTFDPAPALNLLRAELPDAVVAVEELGVGFKVSAPFPDGELQGDITVVPWDELVADPVTRVTFRDPNGTAEDFIGLAERIGLPVLLENEANAAAWGEFVFGPARDIDDMVFVTVGTGLVVLAAGAIPDQHCSVPLN